MARRFINEFTDNDSVNEVFRASNKMLRTNRNGDPYLQVNLSDKTGTLTARMWNANETIYGSFDNGDYVRVDGKTQIFQGAMQMIIKKIYRFPASDVNPDDFAAVSNLQIDKLVVKLTEKIRHMQNPALQALGECYLLDSDFMKAFTTLPAGVKLHHAYPGGLLEHVFSIMEIAERVGGYYEKLDTELLVFGAFLHDTGKTLELEGDSDFAYTDAGQLLGHMQLGISLLEQKIAEAEKLMGEPFPLELALRLKHMILSHHGEYQFGSAKLPMTPEAMVLHCLDLLDSKLATFEQFIADDLNADSSWTTYHTNLERKLFKGLPKGKQGEAGK